MKIPLLPVWMLWGMGAIPTPEQQHSGSRGVPVPIPTDLQGLEGVQVSLTAQQDIVGHVEALADAQVVEEGRLADGVTQLHHGHICGQDGGDAHRTHTRAPVPEAGEPAPAPGLGDPRPLREGTVLAAPEATARDIRHRVER